VRRAADARAGGVDRHAADGIGRSMAVILNVAHLDDL
jgi:hypothetical protein